MMDNCVEIFMQLYVVCTLVYIRGTTPLPQHTIYLWPLCTYGRYKNYFPLRWRKKTNSARSHKAFLEKVFGLEHGEWEMGNVYTYMFFSARTFSIWNGAEKHSHIRLMCANLPVRSSVLRVQFIQFTYSTFGGTWLQRRLRRVQ